MIERLVFGCGHLTAGAGQSAGDRLVAACVSAGVRQFDVAPIYGLGTAEFALGRALQRAGAMDATAITKFGLGRPGLGLVKSYVRAVRRKARQLMGLAPGID